MSYKNVMQDLWISDQEALMNLIDSQEWGDEEDYRVCHSKPQKKKTLLEFLYELVDSDESND